MGPRGIPFHTGFSEDTCYLEGQPLFLSSRSLVGLF